MISAFDTETNIVDGTASPYHKDTRVVLYGDGIPWDANVVVGHNIAFDILHALKDKDTLRVWAMEGLFDPNILLWDTMLVDYLYHASRYRSPSLEETCARWSVPFTKDELIQSYFDAGKGADVLIADGHEERLRKYHAEDLRVTKEVAIRQMAALEGTRLLPVVRTQLEALKFVILEQYCGLPVDLVGMKAEANRVRATVALLEAELKRMVGHEWFNPAAPEQVALVLEGGEYEEEKRVEVGLYKTGAKVGQPRYRIQLTKHPVARRIDVPLPNADEKALTRLSMATSSDWVRQFCKKVLEYRELAKLLGTYLDPIQAQVSVSFDGRLHGDLNLAVTNTGRKSSSNPNLQNMPEEVRKFVKARPGWTIVAADAKQLEVVGAAYLSQDPDLMDLIRRGGDIHTETQEDVRRKGTEVERRAIKGVVFGGWIYGGGPEKVSGQTGVPEATIKEVQTSLKKRFPIASAYGSKVVQPELWQISEPYNDPECPLPHRQAVFELPTGRRLWFRTYKESKPAPWKNNGSPVSWSYTGCKNRPVQSIATGDIVPLLEALMLRELQRIGPSCLEWVHPMVSVHDELVFEVRNDSLMRLMNLIELIGSNVRKEMNSRFQLNPPLELPIKLEVGVGDNWAEAKP